MHCRQLIINLRTACKAARFSFDYFRCSSWSPSCLCISWSVSVFSTMSALNKNLTQSRRDKLPSVSETKIIFYIDSILFQSIQSVTASITWKWMYSSLGKFDWKLAETIAIVWPIWSCKIKICEVFIAAIMLICWSWASAGSKNYWFFVPLHVMLAGLL